MIFLKAKLFILCLVFLHTLLYGQSSIASVQASIDSIYKSNPESIGLIVHIDQPKNNISHTFTAGYSTRESTDTLLSNDVFLIASNAKTYTSVAILRLIEKGELKLTDNIQFLVSDSSQVLLENDGYKLDSITVYHLLSHTSGIADYVGKYYITTVLENKKHRWTRDEQIELSTSVGDPLGKPGEIFQYADVNFLLLTEILEKKTGKAFYTAIKELLRYEELGLDNTWFYTLEDIPANVGRFVHQYWTKRSLDSWEIDPSFDLYGAGGIATTAAELSEFSQLLFNQKIIRDSSILELIYTPAVTTDGKDHHYHLGLQSSIVDGYQLYGHGGFWGTVVQYIPALNTSISIAVLERDKNTLRKDLLETIIPLID